MTIYEHMTDAPAKGEYTMSEIDHDELEAAMRADREAGTPGPWCEIAGHVYADGGELFLCDMGDNGAPHTAMDRANARRIARLPDVEEALLASREEARQLRAERERLLEACEALAHWDECWPSAALGGALRKARAALSPTFDQRDYGDETPDDDGFVTVHPRRDGPGLDVKALACVADLESRN